MKSKLEIELEIMTTLELVVAGLLSGEFPVVCFNRRGRS